MHRLYFCLFCIVCATLLSVGCSTWPFAEVDKTSYRTPSLRTDAVLAFAEKSNGLDTPEQQELTNQLARQIQVEPDPLVREAIIKSISAYRTQLATQVLIAGLQDEDLFVRKRCCNSLASRGEPAAITALATRLRDDSEFDVRIAAAKALGNLKSPLAVAALGVALEDSDPAMQLVGVTSIRNISDQNFGNDVAAWRQYVASQAPAAGSLGDKTSVAEVPSDGSNY